MLPAQSYGILARNTNAFAARYGTNHLVLGHFPTDQLANEGEQVKLSYGAGLGIHDFTYLTTSPWPTNLNGRSIVLVEPEMRPLHSEGRNWSASAQPGGTPGQGDTMTGETFDAWKAAHGITNEADDSDGDGLSAFMEYATGSDPGIASSERLPSLSYDISSNKLRAVIYQSLTAIEAHHELQSSSDLTVWQAAEVENTNSTLLNAVEKLDYMIAISPTAQHTFFRIIVSPK
jgi:hypothetical protein